MNNINKIYKSPEASFSKIPNSNFYIKRYTTNEPINHLLHHYHDSYELYYLYQGERYYFIEDKTYHITSGNFVLISPDEIHQTGNIGKFGFDRMLIHFDKDLLKDTIQFLSINPYEILEKKIHVINLDTYEQAFVETLLKTMEQEYIKNKNKENSYIKISLIQLLLFLNNCKNDLENDVIFELNNTKKMIFEIIGFINNNYNTNLTLETISNKFYLSTYYFSRTFKEITGFNFNEYLNNVRIKEAKKLLIHTNLSIEDIAINVGFTSNTHFGRVFKNIVGLSPSNFKKQEK